MSENKNTVIEMAKQNKTKQNKKTTSLLWAFALWRAKVTDQL